MNTKICSCCKQEKSLDDFYDVKRKTPLVRNIKTDNKVARCKQCYVAKAKEWSAKNIKKRLEISRKYTEKHKDKIKEKAKITRGTESYKNKAKEWRKNNVTTYLRNKRQSDPMFALRFKMRSIIRKAFDRNGYTKRSKSQSILGCTFEQLKKHLESQFQPGMSWENRSEWHIDHIIPLASVKTEEDVIRLNHYTNLQPLWAADNLRKSDKMDYESCAL